MEYRDAQPARVRSWLVKYVRCDEDLGPDKSAYSWSDM